MHLVRNIAVAPGFLRSGSALFYVRQKTIECLLDRSQLDPRMLALLSASGTALLSRLTFRASPSVAPWCQIRLPRVETSSGLFIPQFSPKGIIIPVPHLLITETLAHDLADLSTNAMRYFNPPAH